MRVACSAPSHYLNQCWLIVNRTLGNTFQGNSNRNSIIFILKKNTLENVVCQKWRPFCPGGRWVNISTSITRVTMISSNGNIFRVTGPLCGEFIGHRWIPAQSPVTWSFDVFLSKQSCGWWFETPSRSLWRHCNVLWHFWLQFYFQNPIWSWSNLKSVGKSTIHRMEMEYGIIVTLQQQQRQQQQQQKQQQQQENHNKLCRYFMRYIISHAFLTTAHTLLISH